MCIVPYKEIWINLIYKEKTDCCETKRLFKFQSYFKIKEDVLQSWSIFINLTKVPKQKLATIKLDNLNKIL